MNNNSLSKSLTRYAAIQALYNLSFSKDFEDVKDYFLENKCFFVDMNLKVKFNKINLNKNFFLNLLDLFDKEKDRIDELINLNLSKGWNLNRLPKVQLAILRVAISEMIIYPKLSLGIIISEYIMFTESFFTEKEYSFTNAILENIHKKLNKNLNE